MLKNIVLIFISVFFSLGAPDLSAAQKKKPCKRHVAIPSYIKKSQKKPQVRLKPEDMVKIRAAHAYGMITTMTTLTVLLFAQRMCAEGDFYDYIRSSDFVPKKVKDYFLNSKVAAKEFFMQNLPSIFFIMKEEHSAATLSYIDQNKKGYYRLYKKFRQSPCYKSVKEDFSSRLLMTGPLTLCDFVMAEQASFHYESENFYEFLLPFLSSNRSYTKHYKHMKIDNVLPGGTIMSGKKKMTEEQEAFMLMMTYAWAKVVGLHLESNFLESFKKMPEYFLTKQEECIEKVFKEKDKITMTIQRKIDKDAALKSLAELSKAVNKCVNRYCYEARRVYKLDMAAGKMREFDALMYFLRAKITIACQYLQQCRQHGLQK